MLFFLFSTSLLFSIWRGNCAAILDKYMFNLTSFINQSVIQYKHGTYNYYIKLCSEPTSEQKSDIFVSRCSLSNGVCQPITTRYNMNYFPLNLQNFSEGLIYSADSEPFTGTNGTTYKTSSIEFKLKCDPSIFDMKNFEISISETNTRLITIKGSSSAACPIIVPSPEPTPLYLPKCEFTNRIEKNTTFGINANLSIFNQASFGIKINLIIDGKHRILFYQPCERMTCPPSYTCSTKDLSSAWLCKNHKNERTCVSYGVNIDIYPVDFSDPNKGIMIHTKDKSTNRAMNLTLTCENINNFPNLIRWPNTASISNKTLLLSGSTPQVCIKKIPIPKPISSKFCHCKQRKNEFFSELNSLNLANSGWTKEVILKDGQMRTESILHYHPCRSIACPSNFFCDGDDDTQIWLCSEKRCKSYGTLSATFSKMKKQTTKKELKAVVASYKGPFERIAEVSFVCGTSIENHDLSMPDEVTVEGEKIKFVVKSKQFCRPSLNQLDESESNETEETETLTETTDSLAETTGDVKPDSESLSYSAVMTDETTLAAPCSDSDASGGSSSPSEQQVETEEQASTESMTESDTSLYSDETETASYTTQSDFTTATAEDSSSIEDSTQTEELASDASSFYPSQADDATSLAPTSDETETAAVVSQTTEITPEPSTVNPTAAETVIIPPTATETDAISPTSEFTPNPSSLPPTATPDITPPPSAAATPNPSSTPSESVPRFTDHFTPSAAFTPSSDASKKSKKRRYWILPVVIVGVALFLYFVVGTAIVSIRDRSLHLPNRRFWMRCSKMCSRNDNEYTFKLISDSD